MDVTLGAPFQPPYLAELWEGCPVSAPHPQPALLGSHVLCELVRLLAASEPLTPQA